MLSGQELYYFERAGYFIRRGLLSESEIAACRDAVDLVVAKSRQGLYANVRWADSHQDDFWGVNHILHPAIRERAIVQTLANSDLLSILSDALNRRPRYQVATLLVNPAKRDYDLPWHRDLVRDLAMPPADQAAALARWMGHVQFNAALDPDSSLLVVPGTHSEPLADDVLNSVRHDAHGDVPGQVTVRLEPGDVVFYNSNLLHRGVCPAGRVRRTLHMAFMSLDQPEQPVVPQPYLRDSAFLDSLPPSLRPLFVPEYLG